MDKNRENWGSRLGYIMSMVGITVGLGAIWKFPTMVAQNGGGAFVLAYIIITALVAIPGGWAEISFGRWAQGGPVKALGNILGRKGKILGSLISLVPMFLNMYYCILISYIAYYTICSLPGLYFSDPISFFANLLDKKSLVFIMTMIVIILTGLICMKGIKNGLEQFNKITLPGRFLILAILAIRIAFLPGFSKGIEYYLKPDLSVLKDPATWMLAGGTSFFTLGLGPAFLEVYGSYLNKDSDIIIDYITVGIWSIAGCLLAGFVTVPSVIVFGLNPTSGPGLVFETLPFVFNELSGGNVFAFLFFLALTGAGFSTSISSMEITVNSFSDLYNWNRKKSIIITIILTSLGALLCVYSSRVFVVIDWIVSNIGYNFSAAILSITLAWIVGAKKVREEWINPGSKTSLGKWFDPLYKYLIVSILLYFCITAIITLFTKGI